MLLKLGANHLGGGTYGFLLWAPLHKHIRLRIVSPHEAVHEMSLRDHGYFEATVEGLEPGARYVYVLPDDREFPDPASRWQPDGAHGPSALVDHTSFGWKDNEWNNLPLEEYILYEFHVGTFTPEGTLDDAAGRIDYLRELGINAVELMPVAQFPGSRNWGYDGTYPYAVQESYGGPEALKRFVDHCHANGIAVVMDVVYNHLGPEGNYSGMYGPYLTDRYQTPWGMAVNFDGAHSNGVRRFFIENALYWFGEFHIDALRLDAVHGIIDMSARHFLRELRDEVDDRIERRVYLIPESDLNDVRLIDPPKRGGYGHDALWLDDYHHAIHTLLTGERDGYYVDFGEASQMAKALNEGFIYSGQYSVFRKRNHGNSSAHMDSRRFVVFSQNHDQVGNRMNGDRLTASLTVEQLKQAAALVLLSPSIPLLFMGEEYGETAPFQYFVSHGDPGLIEAVRKGRKEEFSAFAWQGEPPDPQDEETFRRSIIDPELRHTGQHRELFEYYRELIRLRRSLKALNSPSRSEVSARAGKNLLTIHISHENETLLYLASFSETLLDVTLPENKNWRVIFHSLDGSLVGGSFTPNTKLSMGPFGFTVLREEE